MTNHRTQIAKADYNGKTRFLNQCYALINVKPGRGVRARDGGLTKFHSPRVGLSTNLSFPKG